MRDLCWFQSLGFWDAVVYMFWSGIWLYFLSKEWRDSWHLSLLEDWSAWITLEICLDETSETSSITAGDSNADDLFCWNSTILLSTLLTESVMLGFAASIHKQAALFVTVCDWLAFPLWLFFNEKDIHSKSTANPTHTISKSCFGSTMEVSQIGTWFLWPLSSPCYVPRPDWRAALGG